MFLKLNISRGISDVKVFLLKDVAKVGLARELIKVTDGFAHNYLIPNKLAVIVTPAEEPFYAAKAKLVTNRKEILESKSSMLAEKIKELKLSIACKMHDKEDLYGSVGPTEIVKLLDEAGFKIVKTQVMLDKPLKKIGTYDINIKLSNKIQTTFKLRITALSAK